MQRSYLCVVEFTLVKSCSTVLNVTRKSGYMMLHHRIQTDLKGVDAGVQASTPCTSVSTKSCADCRAFCEYDRMQEVAGCSRLHAGGCNLHAGFMQASCSLHTIVCRRLQVAASCMQDVAEAACRLHAACMQAACSLHASLVWHLHYTIHSFHCTAYLS